MQFYIRFHGVDDLLVGTIREPGALLGWSVFRQPYRYTVDRPMRRGMPGAAAPSRNHHEAGADAAASRVPAAQARRSDPRKQVGTDARHSRQARGDGRDAEAQAPDEIDHELLRESPFFETFAPEDIDGLAAHARCATSPQAR